MTSTEPTIQSAKEAKAELQNVVAVLIQQFNKKTNLSIDGIDLNCRRTLGGECFYNVRVNVSI